MDETSGDWTQGRQLLLQRCKSRALSCLNEHEYGRAFAHFIVALTVQPAVKGEVLNAFLFTLEKLVEKMEKEKQVNEVIMCYEQALEVLPQDSHVLHGLATTLFRLGYVECALSYFLKSYQANPFFTPSLYCMENLKNALVERWHFMMLNDKKRNLAYKSAIEKAVGDGYDHVLDIGAGTGILSMLAADANAQKVYACEASEIMFAVLQNVIQVNDKPVHALQKLSTDLCIPEDIPEKVSLIVTEIFDAGLFGENSLETLDHAWDQLLKKEDTPALNENESANSSSVNDKKMSPRAKVIPQSADVYVVPVECERFRKNFRLDNTVVKALDIKEEVFPEVLEEEPYSTEKLLNLPCEYKYLSSPSVMLQANFNSPEDIKTLLQGKVLNPSFNCTESGNLDAFVMWFDLHLDDQETISSAPNKENDSCCWEQAIFYVFPQSLEGASSFCNTNDTITPTFLCKGHLTLQKVTLTNPPQPSTQPTITMDPSLIHHLNSYTSQNLINLTFNDLCPLSNASVLDISTFPVIGLRALKDTAAVVSVLKTQYEAEVERMSDMYGVESGRLEFRSYEELCDGGLRCDVLVVDPVEMCGLMKRNLLEDVTMLRMQCLKDTGIVVPGEIEIHAVLVESATLRENSKLVSDDRVNGYKISQIMNAYKCQIHQDIQFSTLPHQKLTAPFKLCQFDLNSKSETNNTKSMFKDSCKTVEVEASNSGKITAVVYWFALRYRHDCIVDTFGSDGLWKQAAFVLDEEIEVIKGEKLPLQYSLKNGCFQVGVVKC